MEFWLLVVIGILLIIIFILLIKLFFVQKTAREIEIQFAERLMTETNTLIDISYQDKTMRRLAERLNTELRKLRKERHRFQQGDLELKSAVTNISHDLRTPLTAISGYLDLLDNVEKSEAVERYIEVIKNRTEILKQLTEELFRYSIITSPEYDNSVELVVVNGVLEESILGFYAALQERKIAPNISMTENKVIRKVNRAALSRIFSNLINNAIKYSDGDLNITLTDAGKITFSNTASDLSEVDVKRLFDRFYTVENARKSTGLGLSISRILIEQMNGTISAQYENRQLNICIQLPDVSDE
jgi:signal transduction histidine kinase